MDKKSGFVSVIGEANTGKSTLVNSLVGFGISPVTSKAQTTRNRIYAILTRGNVQIIFTDTPGIVNPRYRIQNYMRDETRKAVEEADIILFVFDISKDVLVAVDKVMSRYNSTFAGEHRQIPLICVLSKTDLESNEKSAEVINKISADYNFKEIVPVSAKTGFNLSKLFDVIVSVLPEGEFYYDETLIAAQPERFFVSEIIRRNILELLSDEVPFSVFVDIEEFREYNGKKDFIRASLIVEKQSQKPILIGSKGKMIKTIGQISRKEIESFLGREVFLELLVKVRKNWRNDPNFLKSHFKKNLASVNL